MRMDIEINPGSTGIEGKKKWENKITYNII